MKNPSLQGTQIPNQTLDLSAGLGYGLIYQPVLSAPSFNPFAMQFISLHRRSLHRQFYEKRRSR